MIGYRFLSPADEEMTEASVFYEAATFGLGADFLAEIQQVINALREHPQLGQSIGTGLRRAVLHRFPFSLIYSIEVDAILIVAVAINGAAQITGEAESERVIASVSFRKDTARRLVPSGVPSPRTIGPFA